MTVHHFTSELALITAQLGPFCHGFKINQHQAAVTAKPSAVPVTLGFLQF